MFEVVGIDFLIDHSFRPWLLEVNRVPSMARQVIFHPVHFVCRAMYGLPPLNNAFDKL